eukprot:TRINITY_DN424_c0_g1_i5.p1 TRINITY_DN424_c0_g1~~TRINITY_DN424_c0_g1_i5.p1  ORF type:complete len:367 (+),score=118.49 TRINITY_DN424_c0_g1_i5:599-1699(+)
MVKQLHMCTLSSRAFYNDIFGQYAKFITEYFGYGMVLPMNTGAEAVETALKVARKWGYEKKGIAEDEAIIVSVAGNFHGRTISIIGMSVDEDCRTNFGPFTPGLGPTCPHSKQTLQYNDLEGAKKVFEAHGDKMAGFLVEPIQGEAGIKVPDEDYLPGIYELCQKHNVLFICDEIQTGLCRTGKMLCIEHSNVRPDLIILGKALSGGMYPVSAVLGDEEVMGVIKPGQHGSTYGGNPLGCAVAMEALQILKDDNMAEKAEKMGEQFRASLRELELDFIADVRGKGLLNAIEIDEDKFNHTAWDICLLLKDRGLLAKPTHQNIIRFAPPLVITEEEIDDCISIIKGVLTDIVDMKPEDIPGHEEDGH